MSRTDFPLDLALDRAILNSKRLKNENAIPFAGLWNLGLVLVFELAGGLALFVRKLGPARRRGFFIGEKQGLERK